MTNPESTPASFASDAGYIRLSCQNCGHIDSVFQYRNIDVSIHPEWKDEILKGDFFNWFCPECGRYSELSYPSRYFDPEAELSVVLRPGLDGGSCKEELARINDCTDGITSDSFLHRTAGTFFSVQEIIRIRDAGLDDRPVNLLKPLIIGQLQSMGKEVWNGFFREVTVPDNGNPSGQPYSDALYMVENEDYEQAYSEPVYWFDIHLTDHTVERHGINLTALKLCTQMLHQAGYEQTDDGIFHHFDLSWAIGFHNSRAEGRD